MLSKFSEFAYVNSTRGKPSLPCLSTTFVAKCCWTAQKEAPMPTFCDSVLLSTVTSDYSCQDPGARGQEAKSKRKTCLESREDKGDREGIPQTHPIP